MSRAVLILTVLLVCGSADSTHFSFLQQSLSDRNPLNRDLDDLSTDKGEDAMKGNTRFVLVTTFDTDIPGSGKVWVVPTRDKDRQNSFVIAAGLQTPTGTCFDKNHDFLYVCDPAQGMILQLEIDRSERRRFVLKSDQVATIVQNKAPSACQVDAFGNLFFVDMAQNTVERVNYADLWSGFVDMSTVIYTTSTVTGSVSRPVGIDISRSETLYFVNSFDPEDAGLLNSAPLTPSSPPVITTLLRNDQTPWGLALSKDLAYYSTDDGTVWAYSYRSDQANLYLKTAEFLEAPRGLCYGDGDVYVADFTAGAVFTFPDNRKEEVTPEPFVRVAGAYGLTCINL